MPVLVNRAMMHTSTTGTSDVALGSAIDGYQTFLAAGVSNGDSVNYVIEDGYDWEIGEGVYTDATKTLTRVVEESTNGNAKLNLSGDARVYVSAIASTLNGLQTQIDGKATSAQGTKADTAHGWGDHALQAYLTSVSWGDVIGKPSTFAPSAHSHTISDVTSLQTALDAKAPLGSPTFTGTPSAPTAVSGTNTTQLATTSFVQAAVASIVDGAPGAIDTLNELAAALGDDPNFATTMTNSLAAKANTSSLALVATSGAYADLSGKPTLGSAASLNVASSGNAATGEVVKGNDTRLTDARTPSAHTHTIANVTGLQTALDGKLGTAANAASASKLQTARTITLSGDVSGSFSFDGTANQMISVTVADDSHNHIIGNVDGLENALNDKAPSAHTHTIANVSGLQTALNDKLGLDANSNLTLPEEVQAKSYIETFVSLSGTSPVVNCHQGNVFILSTTGNTTFSFSYVNIQLVASNAYGFTLFLTAGGTHTITWPASVDWAGGTAPDAPASGETDVLVFVTKDGGGTWYGALAVDAAA